MKNSLNSLKALAVGTALAAASVAVQAVPANALSLTFKPTGNPFLDSDTIRDLEVTPGSLQLFDLFLTTDGLADNETVSEIEYTFNWSNAELSPQVGDFALSTTHFPGTPNLFAAIVASSATSATFRQQGGAIAADEVLLKVATLGFKAGSVLSNDGFVDFSLEFDKALNQFGTPFSSLTFSQAQEVEVQQAVPTPALLPGLIGMGMALVRKRRAQSEEQAA